MCGIVGIVGKGQAAPSLVEGLRRLEYRGYDSAGIAVLNNGSIERRRAEGKLKNLENLLQKDCPTGLVGIGHTRWATHGAPNENNAHPHATKKVAVVHNGIIENFRELRTMLEKKGHEFKTETDSETVVHLITDYLDQGLSPQDAVKETLGHLDGAFALAIIFTGEHDLMIGARRGSPLAVGYGDGEMFLGSDALGLAPMTQKISYLEEGDWVVLNRTGAKIYNNDNQPVERDIKLTELSGAATGKGDFEHYMIKEIHEQPSVIGDTLHQLLNNVTRTVHLPDLPFDLQKIERVRLLACGTSYHAAMVAKYWIEQYAQLPVEVDIASEFRYRHPVFGKNELAIFISQSGETADTLAAMRLVKNAGHHTLALVNVPTSTIAREADAFLMTLAGPEIGVASTKAFTTQLAVLAAFAIYLARARGKIDAKTEAGLVASLTEMPAKIIDILAQAKNINDIAEMVSAARSVLYFGRNTNYPIALEGALKLKEISYIHAEGYAAGEMKHGPIALIDENVPIVVIAPSDDLFDKTISNVQEVAARGGKVVFISDQKGMEKLGDMKSARILMPDSNPFIAPVLYSVPVQLLAYYVALHKGTDVDQPRNLAKSVTVE